MTLPRPPLDYATDDAAVRLAAIRRLFAWVAVGYAAIAATPLVAGIIRVTLEKTPLVGIELAGAADAYGTLLLRVAVMVGGVLMLRGRPVGLPVVRVSAVTLAASQLLVSICWQISFDAFRLTGPEVAMRAGQLATQAAGTPLVLFLFSFPLRPRVR